MSGQNAQAPVDVVAVMAGLIGNTRTMAGLTGDPRMREHLREGEQARAAVAELIEVAKVGVMFADRRKSLDNADTITPAQSRDLIQRLRAALARVGGA